MANHDFAPSANFTYEDPGVFRMRAMRDMTNGEEVKASVSTSKCCIRSFATVDQFAVRSVAALESLVAGKRRDFVVVGYGAFFCIWSVPPPSVS